MIARSRSTKRGGTGGREVARQLRVGVAVPELEGPGLPGEDCRGERLSRNVRQVDWGEIGPIGSYRTGAREEPRETAAEAEVTLAATRIGHVARRARARPRDGVQVPHVPL